MTKSVCQVCGETFRGIPLYSVSEGKQVEVCPPCYKRLDEAYKKNSCLACVFFNIVNCELFSSELEEPYVKSASCTYFTTSKDPQAIAKAKIKKFEATKRFEDAAKEYEKLGNTSKADEMHKKAEKQPQAKYTVNELVKQLSQQGQALTYYCCHCGEKLKVGAKQEPQKTCPKCKGDLTVIDLAKLINQHI
jgi:transcription initiation factor IIE alpha subunit